MRAAREKRVACGRRPAGRNSRTCSAFVPFFFFHFVPVLLSLRARGALVAIGERIFEDRRTMRRNVRSRIDPRRVVLGNYYSLWVAARAFRCKCSEREQTERIPLLKFPTKIARTCMKIISGGLNRWSKRAPRKSDISRETTTN